MKKSFCLIAATVLIILVFGACTTLIKNDETSTEDAPSGFSMDEDVIVFDDSQSDNMDLTKETTYISKTLSSGVEIDADVNGVASLPGSMLRSYEVKIEPQDLDEILDILAPQKEIITRNIDVIAENRISNKMLSVITSDEFMLSTDKENISFTGALFSEKCGHVFITDGEERNDNKYLTGIQLDFATSDEVIKKCDDIIDSFGISVESPTCYTLDYETMSSENDRLNEMFF